MTQNIIDFILIFIGIISSFYVARLAERKGKNTFDSLIYLTLLSIIIWFGGYVIKYFQNNDKTEHAFEYSIEGTWIEEYKNEKDSSTMYALIDLKFDPQIKKLNLKGIAYDSQGQEIANWNATSINYDGYNRNIIYLYHGNFDKGNLPSNDGYAEINFISTLKDEQYVSATGYFCDKYTNNEPRNFEIDRVSCAQCKDATGKEFLEYSNDRKNFIKKLDQKKRLLKNKNS